MLMYRYFYAKFLVNIIRDILIIDVLKLTLTGDNNHGMQLRYIRIVKLLTRSLQ